jgi:hypothetical protein
MTYARVAMSINTNNREGRKAFFVWTSSGSVASASIIIALTLMLGNSYMFILLKKLITLHVGEGDHLFLF